MSQMHYARPPITEAVVEVRFSDLLNVSDIEKINTNLKNSYEIDTTVASYEMRFDLPPNLEQKATAGIASQSTGKRLTSQDQTEILIIWPNAFIVSQLAPYPGWDEFVGRFQRDWMGLKRTIGFKKVARLGLRFVNRLDVPMTSDSKVFGDALLVEESEYLHIFPNLPDALGPTTSYGIEAQFPPDSDRLRATIRSASVSSPLLDHASFSLDIDVFTDGAVPQNDGEILRFLGRMRDKKNATFEACVSDKARELFER